MTTTNSPYTMCEKHNEMHRTGEPCRVCEMQKKQPVANATQPQPQRTIVSNV